MRTSHYELLGVSPGASSAELKAAYRAKVKELHPDSGGSDEEFEALQGAWSVLSDETRRRDYDSWLEDTRSVMGGARLAVQQRYEERELEVERRAWDARREEARKAAAVAAARRQAAEDARDAAVVAKVDVRRHLTLGVSSLAVLISGLELWRGGSGGSYAVEVLGATFPLPPTTTTVLMSQIVLGLAVAAGAVAMRPPGHAGGAPGANPIAGSRQFRIAVGVASALLSLWVLVPFLLRVL